MGNEMIGDVVRIGKYDVIDHLNQLTNIIISSVNPSDDRDKMLLELKRAKELVNNL